MKIPWTLGFLLILCAPVTSPACEPTAAQQEDFYVRSRQSEETYLVRLAKEADQIFIGVVTEVDELEKGPYVQLAHIKVERMIKGRPNESATALMYLRHNPERDNPKSNRFLGCGDIPDPARVDPYVLKTYKYLFYVKNGILTRSNGFPLGPPPLEPNDEVKLLQKIPGVVSGK